MMVKKALLRAIGRRCDALIDWFETAVPSTGGYSQCVSFNSVSSLFIPSDSLEKKHKRVYCFFDGHLIFDNICVERSTYVCPIRTD